MKTQEFMKGLLYDEEYCSILKWHDDIMSGKYNCIICVSNESRAMLEIAGGIPNDVTILTREASLANAEYFANYYRKYRKFPKIAFCECIMFHGRRVNRVIDEVKDKTLALLADEKDRHEVKARWRYCMTIHIVTYGGDKHLLLETAYIFALKVAKKIGHFFEFAADITSIVSHDGSPLMPYVYTLNNYPGIECKMKGSVCTHTGCQDNNEDTILFPIMGSKGLSAIATIRFIKHHSDGNLYTVIPYVLLPELSEKELQRLTGQAFSGMSEDTRQWCDKLSSLSNGQLLCDLLVLFLSHSVLCGVLKNASLGQIPICDAEIKRLAENFTVIDSSSAKQYLLSFLQTAENYPISQCLELLQSLSSKTLFLANGTGLSDAKVLKERIEEVTYDSAYYREMAAATGRIAKDEHLAEEELNAISSHAHASSGDIPMLISLILQFLDVGYLEILHKSENGGFQTFIRVR